MKSIFFLFLVSFVISTANAHGVGSGGGCPTEDDFESSNYDCRIHFWDEVSTEGVSSVQQKNYEFKDILKGKNSDWKVDKNRKKVVYTTAKGTEIFLGANMSCSYSYWQYEPDKNSIDIYIEKGETRMLDGIYVRPTTEFRYVFEVDRNDAFIACSRKKTDD